MGDKIRTAAEAAEADVIPKVHEIHADPQSPARLSGVPKRMKGPIKDKSAAQWAYERLILYIQNFEAQLDSEQEIAMGFAGGDAGVLRIEGMGYFDPDIVTFYGSDANGSKTQLVQHVSQLSVILRALPKQHTEKSAARIGFRLAADLEGD